jgi:hypothetical protein
MPKLLVARFTADSVAQFRIAARMRYDEARSLAGLGHGTAAIYLWGYTAEMVIKAAWFTLIGIPETRPIGPTDLAAAVAVARAYGIVWPPQGRYHAIFHWGQLVVQHRMALAKPYPSPRFGRQVIEHSRRIYDCWREVIRYKKNRAYPSEVATVAESTQWLLANSIAL